MSESEIESDPQAILGYCSVGDKVLVLIVGVPGPQCTSVLQAANAIMDYKCVREYFDRGQALKFSVIAGTEAHQEFVDIYGLTYAPVIIVLGIRGRPSGIVKIDPERESYCALMVKLAISEGLTGGNTPCQVEVKETLDKSFNTVGDINGELMEVNLDALKVDVFERNEIARDVAAQCSIWTLETTQKPFEMLVNSVQDGTEPTKNTAAVWSVDRISSLPPGTASRLMIILPNQRPVHAAASTLATMNDVSSYVSSVLNIPSHCLEISTRYPHHIFSDDEMLRKMDELGLVPTAVLLVKIKAALVQQTWGLSAVIHNIVVTITRPFLAILSGFWSRVQSIFYSSSEEDETDEDDDDNEDSPPRPPKKRMGNVRTLFDRDDDGKDRVPNYNGNSTQLL